MTPPLYLAVPPGPLHDACLHAFPPGSVSVVSLEEVGGEETGTPGVVLVEPDQLPLGELLAVADRAYRSGPGWRFVLVRRGDPVELQVLSLGHPEALPYVADGIGPDDLRPGTLMELRELLHEVAKARHDINNPLTSALAEAQLLLMDVEEEGEVRDGLEVIQTQLRRIRDLVAATGHIRPPRIR